MREVEGVEELSASEHQHFEQEQQLKKSEEADYLHNMTIKDNCIDETMLLDITDANVLECHAESVAVEGQVNKTVAQTIEETKEEQIVYKPDTKADNILTQVANLAEYAEAKIIQEQHEKAATDLNQTVIVETVE